MKLLIDIGGSGIKMSNYSNGQIGSIVKYTDIKDYQQFISAIKRQCGNNPLSALAVSVAGFVDAEKGYVRMCKNADFLEGELVKKLKSDFKFIKVSVVNDGEAHARALLCAGDRIQFGAIHLAFGTSVSFCVIDQNKKIVRPCNGENWDIGDMKMITSNEGGNDVWNALGGEYGLAELEKKVDPKDPYHHYGCRVGNLLSNLAVIFRPRTIGLSGGIISAHMSEIRSGIDECYENPPYMEKPQFAYFPNENSVMKGLTTLL